MKRKLFLLGFLVLFLFTGCSNIKDAETNCIYINKKGALTEAIIEVFDEETYDKEDLKNSILSAVEQYNEEIGSEVVKVTRMKVKKNQTNILVQYQSYADYAKLNGVELFFGTLEEASDAGYDMNAAVNAGSEETQVTLAQLLEADKDYHVIIVKEAIQIETAKDIEYVSGNITTLDKRLAQAGEAAKEGAEVPEILSDYAYIVYK